MPVAKILVGLPGTGKSTFCKMLQEQEPEHDWYQISSDYFLEKKMKEENLSYREAFDKYIQNATGNFWHKLKKYSREGKNLIIDRTNLTIDGRKKVIQTIANNMKKGHGYYFEFILFDKVSFVDALKRLEIRQNIEGKNIPFRTLLSMAGQYQAPTQNEIYDACNQLQGH